MKSKEYKLRILPLFEKDLYDATDYIRYNLNNPHAAAKLIDDIEYAIFKRKDNPESFEKFSSTKERTHPYFRIYIGNYIVFYVVIDDVMEVRRLIYNKRQINLHI